MLKSSRKRTGVVNSAKIFNEGKGLNKILTAVMIMVKDFNMSLQNHIKLILLKSSRENIIKGLKKCNSQGKKSTLIEMSKTMYHVNQDYTLLS